MNTQTQPLDTVGEYDELVAWIDQVSERLRQARAELARQRAALLGERYPSLRLVPCALASEMAEG